MIRIAAARSGQPACAAVHYANTLRQLMASRRKLVNVVLCFHEMFRRQLRVVRRHAAFAARFPVAPVCSVADGVRFAGQAG